ncbi:MAG: DMT family transporter [Thermoanaerobaculia bacterium]|nr:DMT family transporter [Thermoanaerobaculia bacterium]
MRSKRSSRPSDSDGSSVPGARLRLLGAALLFSTGGAAIKATELTGWQVASTRSGVAALTLLVLLPRSRRLASPRVWIVGLGYAATMILYVVANKLTTAANTIFLQSTAPLYVLLLGPLVLGERVRTKDLSLMALIALGMTFFFVDRPPTTEIAADPLTGNLLAAGAGLSWALTIVGLRWLQREGPGSGIGGRGAASVVAGNILACLISLPMALPISVSETSDWGWILYLGVVQVGIAYWFLTEGIRRVSALEASLLLLLEPVLNPVWAWWLHGETPGVWSIAGGAIILAGTLLRSLRAAGRHRVRNELQEDR